MPGIFGAYKGNYQKGIAILADRMIHAMGKDREYRSERMMDESRGLLLGRLSLGILNPVTQPITDSESGCSIVFHGELYGSDAGVNDPKYVLSRYIQEGDSCVRGLPGIFHGALYDGRSHQVKLFSDKFGLQPLYYALVADGLVFAGEVKGLLQDPLVSREPDLRSVADFLHYGQILGDKTLFREVKLLPPGSVVTYGRGKTEVSLDRYWSLENLFVERGAYDERLDPEEVVSLLEESVRKRAGNREVLGLSLSGGLDSRGILAGLAKDARSLHTYTLGLPGCADERLAGRMARVAGTQHEFVELGESYLTDFERMASSMIVMSDGMYHPHESTEMAALQYFGKAPFKVLLRGHGGEIAKASLAYPVMARPDVYSCANGKEVLSYIFNTANLVIRDIPVDSLFKGPFREIMNEGPEKSLEESCGGVCDYLAPADTCIYYYVNEHIRRQVVSSLEIFRTEIECRMPYIDEVFVERLLKLPVKDRNAGEIQVRLVRRCMPKLIRIPDSNTGAPLDAGPLRLFATDKLNSLLKRFSISGFRHYTEYQRWHREGFREVSRRIIFSEETAGRKLYNMEHLKTVYDLHMSGKKDYGHLLGTVVGLELWYRMFAGKTDDQ